MKDDEKGSSFEDERCEMVYENGRCSRVRCVTTVLPPGACCPICGKFIGSPKSACKLCREPQAPFMKVIKF